MLYSDQNNFLNIESKYSYILTYFTFLLIPNGPPGPLTEHPGPSPSAGC